MPGTVKVTKRLTQRFGITQKANPGGDPMSEIDLRGQATGIMTLNPGNDYLIMSSYSTIKTLKWEVVGDKPFDIKVKGITLYLGFLPNPFNSDWEPADANYRGQNGWFGKRREDTHVTIHVVVRTNQSNLHLKCTGAWQPGGGISIPF